MLTKEHPAVFEKLSAIVLLLELHYRDMQRVEFTVQDGKFYILGVTHYYASINILKIGCILQTQTSNRSAVANVKTAVSMVKEKLITREEAILRILASQMTVSQFRTADPALCRAIA